MSSADPPKPKRQHRKGASPLTAPPAIPPTPADDAGVSAFGGCYRPADFQKWGKMPYWTPVEASCLTLGFDPVALVQADDEGRLLQPLALDKVQYRLELFNRAVGVGLFAFQIPPSKAIGLLDGRDEPVPPELRGVVAKIRAYGRPVELPSILGGSGTLIPSGAQALEDEEEFPSSKSGMAIMIATLQKLLLAVAHDAYRFQPDRAHNPTVKLILKALDKVHLKISEDAIQRHLNRAAEAYWLGPFRRD